MITVITKLYPPPPFCEKEILRYAGCKSSDDKSMELLNQCLNEVTDVLSYKVCYCELPIKITNDICQFSGFSVQSEQLSKTLMGCKNVLIFGATLGSELDRLIAKYGRISPSKALMMQAIGAERIEALCDMFCNKFAAGKNIGLTPRFSPGYGDLSLDVQKDIFNILDCTRKIGLSLNNSLLMSPSKSVTAFAGITDIKNSINNKCRLCDNTNCTFRSIL